MRRLFKREPASGEPIHPNGALAVKIAVRGTVKMVWYSADRANQTGKWRPRFSVDEYRKKTGHTPVNAAHQLDEQFETEAQARERAKQAAIEYANNSPKGFGLTGAKEVKLGYWRCRRYEARVSEGDRSTRPPPALKAYRC